ncbi:MAG TPA: hypothetical protein VMU05_17810 [Dongiaceae bacterium]|nr:hypothetical protein [Dongiaceae bacterium]
MVLDRKVPLSFIVKTTGEMVRTMPDEEEFTPSQIRDYVAGPPQVVCETRDGFLLFQNRDAGAQGLQVNSIATAVYAEVSSKPAPVSGRVFLAHPDHVAPYWRRQITGATNR